MQNDTKIESHESSVALRCVVDQFMKICLFVYGNDYLFLSEGSSLPATKEFHIKMNKSHCALFLHPEHDEWLSIQTTETKKIKTIKINSCKLMTTRIIHIVCG